MRKVHGFDSLEDKLRSKEIDLEFDPLKIMLCTSGYRPQSWHQYKSDVTDEVAGCTYPPGGVQLVSIVVTGSLDEGNLCFDAAVTALEKLGLA